MPDEKLTKNQRRDAAREAARLEREKQKKRDTRNRILIRGGSSLAIVAILAVVGLVIFNSTRPAGPGPANMASDGIVLTGDESGIVATTTPGIKEGGSPTETDTAALEREVNIVTYVDYMCPFCNQFETTNASQIESLLSSGIASLEVHPIAILDSQSLGTSYSTRSANAAACVAALDPDSFLDVQTAFFANQPEEQTAGLTDDELIGLVQGAGVDDPAVDECITDQTYKSWVTSATERARGNADLVDSAGNFGTPRVVVNGQIYEGSLTDASAFLSFVQQAAQENPGTTATPTPNPTDTPAPSPTPTSE